MEDPNHITHPSREAEHDRRIEYNQNNITPIEQNDNRQPHNQYHDPYPQNQPLVTNKDAHPESTPFQHKPNTQTIISCIRCKQSVPGDEKCNLCSEACVCCGCESEFRCTPSLWGLNVDCCTCVRDDKLQLNGAEASGVQIGPCGHYCWCHSGLACCRDCTSMCPKPSWGDCECCCRTEYGGAGLFCCDRQAKGLCSLLSCRCGNTQVPPDNTCQFNPSVLGATGLGCTAGPYCRCCRPRCDDGEFIFGCKNDNTTYGNIEAEV